MPQLKTFSNYERDHISCPTVNGHLHLSLHLSLTLTCPYTNQSFLKKEQPLTSDIDSYSKISTRSVDLVVDLQVNNISLLTYKLMLNLGARNSPLQEGETSTESWMTWLSNWLRYTVPRASRPGYLAMGKTRTRFSSNGVVFFPHIYCWSCD